MYEKNLLFTYHFIVKHFLKVDGGEEGDMEVDEGQGDSPAPSPKRPAVTKRRSVRHTPHKDPINVEVKRLPTAEARFAEFFGGKINCTSQLG